MLSSMPQGILGKFAPIAVGWMPSTMTVSEPVEDEHGSGYGDPVTITHVRFERATAYATDASGGAQGGYVYATDAKGRVFVDATNSDGAYEVPELSLVSVDGADPMEVIRVNEQLNPDGSVHHWEVEVR